MGEPLTIGILGANSWIANAAVIPAINECPNAILGASGARSGPIGYPDVLSDPDVDAVYIALANGDLGAARAAAAAASASGRSR